MARQTALEKVGMRSISRIAASADRSWRSRVNDRDLLPSSPRRRDRASERSSFPKRRREAAEIPRMRVTVIAIKRAI